MFEGTTEEPGDWNEVGMGVGEGVEERKIYLCFLVGCLLDVPATC